jgi:glycosyltransferase involved in cell wall biosynthesis
MEKNISNLKFTLVVPTMNEIIGMREIMPRVNRELLHQIIILDGGSNDGTIEYAREMRYELYSQKERGIRLGLIENYPNITGDIIITFSPDGNSVPELIPDLIEKMKQGYDMVIVSRYLGDARSFDDTFMSRLGNWFFTKLINFLFGFHYTDALVMFRAYKRFVPDKLGILKRRSALYEYLIGMYISWEPQISVRAAKQRLKITEIPGDEPLRVEDLHRHGNRFLPPTRIHHFRSGLAMLYMCIVEFFRNHS